MKCHVHPDVDSVDTCSTCKKPMCEQCRLDYDGKIVCKPCAMSLVDYFCPATEGGFDSWPAIGSNVTYVENSAPGSRLIKVVESRVKDRVAKVDLSAFPFSTARTNHRVIFEDGQEVFALCAIDALGVPSMTGRDTTLQSRCAECNRELRILIKHGRIISSDPENIAVYLNDGDLYGREVDTCCYPVNFFCSEDELYQWLWVHPDFESGEVYSLDDAFECCKNLFGNVPK